MVKKIVFSHNLDLRGVPTLRLYTPNPRVEENQKQCNVKEST